MSGAKNSGKTTLIARLLPILGERGLRVGVIKHDGHRFDADRPGTDTHRFLEAGARGTAVVDGEKCQLVLRGAFDERALLPLFQGMDLVLLEGFKHSDYPKLELLRPGAAPLCAPETLLALVVHGAPVDSGVPVLHPDDLEGIVEVILKHLGTPD